MQQRKEGCDCCTQFISFSVDMRTPTLWEKQRANFI